MAGARAPSGRSHYDTCASSQSATSSDSYPTAIKPTQIMPEIGQLMYPNTRSRAKHIYTEEEVRVVS